MADGTFSRSVMLLSQNAEGFAQNIELWTVQEGFRALNRGLEGFCLDHPEWHLAFHALSRAILDPAPEQVEAAREALDLLASRTRMTAVETARRQSGAFPVARRTVH